MVEELTLGEKITLLRNRKKLSKKELSTKTGIHWTNISKYEHNRSTPSVDILKKIAVALDASADYLLFGKRVPDMVDKELLLLSEKVDQLPENDRAFIKNMIRSSLDRFLKM